MASLARRCRVNSSALEINVLSEASALMSRSALGNRRNLRDMGMTVFFFHYDIIIVFAFRTSS